MNSTTEPVTPKALNQWALDAAAVRQGIGKARLWLMKAIRAAEGDNALVADLESANSELFTAQETSQRLVSGVGVAAFAHALPPGLGTQASIPLEQLDTPDTRELLALLEHAQAVAERIDRARGRTVGEKLPLYPGESAGTDLAESVSLLALRVRGEVHGARSPHE